MADVSNVDAEKIRATVPQLEQVAAGLTAQVNKVKDAVANLDRGWISTVKAEFMTRYRKDEAAMQEMLEQFRELNDLLKETANDFEQTEREILSSLSVLK
ncbi:MAG TPA: WXG100 family type VII secretion target [Negativicutes bacterium]|jgi:Proteins of 100 residues with WXG.|nr:WXG100 family type VII secretion target [Negativicutes bacterium]